jgi:putative nucleotidyltransferase with HDIG domain
LDSPARRSARALQLAHALREPGSADKAGRVGRLVSAVGKRLDLAGPDLEAAELAASVYEVGRLAIPDALLAKTGALDADEWRELSGHVTAAAALLSGLPELRPLAPLVHATHERWDGEGYPDGAAGEAIPLASRIIGACDAYVAMTSDRPFRKALDEATALQQLAAVSGSQLDPRIVAALCRELSGRNGQRAPRSRSRPREAPRPGGGSLMETINAAPPPPALELARTRALEALSAVHPAMNETLARLETDPGIVVHVMSEVNLGRPAPRAVVELPEAVDVLGWEALRRVVGQVPVRDFLWPQGPKESALEASRLHAVAVQRAALRLAEAIGYEQLDELAVPALLHDIGRLPLFQAHRAYGERLEGTRSPDARLRIERRLFGVDHATLGGLLARRWGLPERIAATISTHHDETGDLPAQLIQLGDVLAHQSHRSVAMPARMIKLGYALGVSPDDLRAISFELPHSDGSRRARPEPCPLTPRELQSVRGLAEGKVYGQIAHDLGLSASTVRSHLHKAYEKIGVHDRAQAVLIASQRGWV